MDTVASEVTGQAPKAVIRKLRRPIARYSGDRLFDVLFIVFLLNLAGARLDLEETVEDVSFETAAILWRCSQAEIDGYGILNVKSYAEKTSILLPNSHCAAGTHTLSAAAISAFDASVVILTRCNAAFFRGLA
jgi:hypothetical protein